jgi:hypothetical protein
MKLNLLPCFAALLLSACSQDPVGVRIINDGEKAAQAAPVAVKPKTEPVFYNGKTYQVSLAPVEGGGATVSIAGMGPNQAKDASGLHHFACKDSQKAVLNAAPAYSESLWQAQGRCTA